MRGAMKQTSRFSNCCLTVGSGVIGRMSILAGLIFVSLAAVVSPVAARPASANVSHDNNLANVAADAGQHFAPPLYVASAAPAYDAPLRDYAPASDNGSAAASETSEEHPIPFVLNESTHHNVTASRRVMLATSVAVVPGGFGVAGSSAYNRALDCMTMAIAYEAGNQPVAGLESVGQVILNRVRTSRYPKSVCGVVFQGAERSTGCQFTFACDGSLRRHLKDDTLARSRAVAQAVLTGSTADHVAGATNYHADYVQPYWANTGTRVTKIGAHIFYRMPGDGSTSAGSGSLSDEPELVLARMTVLRPRAMIGADTPRAVFAPWGLPMTGTPQK